MKTMLILFMAILLSAGIFAGCSTSDTKREKGYEEISALKAKEIMEKQKGYLILDVRTQEEYDSGHIKNAVLLPLDEIEKKAGSILPDKEQLLLVYCRSGRRSKIAAKKLVAIGYKNIKEFGGINDWPYGTIK